MGSMDALRRVCANLPGVYKQTKEVARCKVAVTVLKNEVAVDNVHHPTVHG